MTGIAGVLAKASRSVTPTAEEETRLLAMSKGMLDSVRAAATGFPEVRGVHLGGSFAKGTWLPKDVDIDIFVRLSPETDEARFEKVGLEIGERAVKGYPHGKKYAQHPYTEAKVDGVKVNIVPCYDVERGRWRSAADRSLYHVEFMNQNLDKGDKLQVRLLKRFMKVVGVYGAEIQSEGFSGYAAEVLVHDHGKFEQVLGYFATLKTSETEPFSLRDPVDRARELATAISGETVARMVVVSRAFIDSPNLSYFKGVKRNVRRGLVNRLYCVMFEHAELSEDTLWGELKKSSRQLVKQVQAEGFRVVRFEAVSNNKDKSAILLLPEVDELPELEERIGPSVQLGEEAKRFVTKNRQRFELLWIAEDGRLHALQKRQFTRLRSLLQELCDEQIHRIGLSRDIARSIERTGRVLVGEDIEGERKAEKWLRDGVESIVSDSLGTDTG